MQSAQTEAKWPAENVLQVAVLMKQSRFADFSERQVFPAANISSGLAFFFADHSRSLQDWMPFDILLHKATDTFTVASPQGPQSISYPETASYISSFMKSFPAVTIIALPRVVELVADRQRMFTLIHEACRVLQLDGHNVHCPETCTWGTRDHDPYSMGMKPPVIVKPMAACGAAHAHKMALALGAEYQNMDVPLPAVASAFIDHSGILHKLYILGDQVFINQAPSIADSSAVLSNFAYPQTTVINFDSLQPLPSVLQSRTSTKNCWQPWDPALLQDINKAIQTAANTLLLLTGVLPTCQLTLLGVDLAIEHQTGKIYIIDVNYFPSFKGILEAGAAMHQALKQAHQTHCNLQRLTGSGQ